MERNHNDLQSLRRAATFNMADQISFPVLLICYCRCCIISNCILPTLNAMLNWTYSCHLEHHLRLWIYPSSIFIGFDLKSSMMYLAHLLLKLQSFLAQSFEITQDSAPYIYGSTVTDRLLLENFNNPRICILVDGSFRIRPQFSVFLILLFRSIAASPLSR